jgi:exodeoxyribonuclease-5
MSEIVLTDDQKRAVKSAVKTLMKPRTIFQISGPGGSGKTTISRIIADQLMKCGAIRKVNYCAPTHKACKVLREVTGETAQTIQSFLNMTIDYDEKGRVIYTLGKPQILSNQEMADISESEIKELCQQSLLFIDEISMVSELMMQTIIKYQERYGFRIITLGDSAQLPPVNQDEPAFYQKFPIHAEFTENLRNSDVAYNQLLNQIRTMILTGNVKITPFDVYKLLSNGARRGIVQMCPHILKGIRKHKDLKTKSLSSAIKQVDHLKDMLLAYRTTSTTSKTVSKLNKRCRRRLYGKDADEYVAGERLMVTGYISYCTKHNDHHYICSNKYEDATHTVNRYHKCDELVVQKASVTEMKFYDRIFKVWQLTVTPGGGMRITIYRVMKGDRGAFSDYKKEVWGLCKDMCVTATRDARKQIWNKYHQLSNIIHAPIQYSYAMSIHMSQGSTTNNVYLYITDFLWLLYNQESDVYEENCALFLKLLYTGLSRAKSTAVVF